MKSQTIREGEMMIKPKVGTVTLAFPGYHLGEEKACGKHKELIRTLGKLDFEILSVDKVGTNVKDLKQIGQKFRENDIDFICVLLATFVPDHFIIELLDQIDVPIVLWALDRDVECISLVCCPLITATLYELKKHYQLFVGEFSNEKILAQLKVFARAAATHAYLHKMRVGYIGSHPTTMFSMSVDLYGIKQVLGSTVVSITNDEFLKYRDRICEGEAQKDWDSVKKVVGKVSASDQEGVVSSRSFLAIIEIAKDLNLDAVSINCWPYLKGQVCLPIARLNDMGIGAGCEGDLHSTIIMRLLYLLSGQPAFNGDLMKLFQDKNQIMFSHCGAGSFSLARNKQDITLHENIESKSGVSVFYPANITGTVTAVNLMGARSTYRMCTLTGEVEETDMVYEGNPMRVRFQKDIIDIVNDVAKYGFGHHWSIVYADVIEELSLLCRFLGIEYKNLSSK